MLGGGEAGFEAFVEEDVFGFGEGGGGWEFGVVEPPRSKEEGVTVGVA